MTNLTTYAVLNQNGICVNRVLWDGITEWQPPEGHTAISDPDNLYPIYVEPVQQETADLSFLQDLTQSQKEALLAYLQQN